MGKILLASFPLLACTLLVSSCNENSWKCVPLTGHRSFVVTEADDVAWGLSSCEQIANLDSVLSGFYPEIFRIGAPEQDLYTVRRALLWQLVYTVETNSVLSGRVITFDPMCELSVKEYREFLLHWRDYLGCADTFLLKDHSCNSTR